jgi:hypothetical protein
VLLLLSLALLVFVMYPVLDHGDVRRLILGVLMFSPLLLATVRLSERTGWVWPTVLLMSVKLLAGVVSTLFPVPILVGLKGSLLGVFFGLTASGLFPYLKNANSFSDAHLQNSRSSVTHVTLFCSRLSGTAEKWYCSAEVGARHV